MTTTTKKGRKTEADQLLQRMEYRRWACRCMQHNETKSGFYHFATERQNLCEFTTGFDVVPADAAICEMGGDFPAKYAPIHGIDLFDALIAATSVICDIPLATLNKKHFPMLGNVVIPYRRRS